VIYVRVSSDPRGHQRSVSEQEAECRAVCEGEGWQVAQVYCDNDRSASRFATKARPGFAAMLAALDLGKTDVLLTWESSRAQRDLGTFVELRQALMSRGVRWHYGERCYDMSKARDRKETARDALDAEGASDETSERVQRSVRASAAAGRPHGKLLCAYWRQYDPTTRALVGQFPHPEQAEVVRECAARMARGEALYAVAADLNARDVPAPRSGQWDPTQVRRLCVNPSYIAKRTHRGVVVGDAVGLAPTPALSPVDRRQDWGGPHYLGVLLVHAGPGLLIILIFIMAARAHRRRSRPTQAKRQPIDAHQGLFR